MAMSVIKFGKSIFVILLLLTSASIFAEVDELQSQLLSSYDVPFRWDAVSDKEYWVKGNKPLYEPKTDTYKIRLNPGEFTIVRIPRGENLLLDSHSDFCEAENFGLSFSQGTGLYIKSFFKHSEKEKKGLFITENFSESVSLARIENRKNHIIDISLFVSKKKLLSELAPYRDVISLPGKTVLLCRGYEAGLQKFQYIETKCATDIKVIGPVRLAIESHFAYPDSEGTLFQNWEIETFLDSKPLKCLKYNSTMENISSVFVNGKRAVVSKRETAYLDIPCGEHILCLKSNAPLYVRVLAQKWQDFIFKSDSPCGYGKEITDKHLEKIERDGLHAAWDNRFREGAVLGASLIQDAALKRKDYSAVQTAYDNLVDYNTFYRNLVPVQLGNDHTVQYHTFMLSKLLEIGASREPYYTDERFLREYLARLGDASFVRIPNSNIEEENAYLLYQLTPSPAATWLRVLINLQPESVGQSFWVQVDKQKPFLFDVSDLEVLDKSYYAVSAGESGLNILKKQNEVLCDASFKEPFSYETIRSSLVSVGTFEIPIPASAKTVKIWKTCQKNCPLEVALQQRASKVFQPTEYRYLTLVQTCDKAALRKKFLTLVKNYPNSLQENDELTNYWIPLVRFLNAEYKLYANAVVKSTTYADTGDMLCTKKLQNLNENLQREIVSKDWLNALETAGKIANGTKDNEQFEAKLLQSDILKNLNENYLAEQILRAQFVNEPRPIFREKTLAKLMKYYQESTNNIEKQTFYAAALKIHPTTEVFQALVETLAKNGNFDLAMMLALLLEDSKQPTSAMLITAYQLGWWQVMDRFINCLDRDQQHYWLALKGRMFKQYTEVLANFNKSNTVEPTTLRLRPDLISSHAGGELLYSVDRNFYTQTYKATKRKPLTLKFSGPLRLHLESRPLHLKNNLNPIDGWIEVRSKNKLWVTSINNNTASEELILLDNAKEVPGRRVVSEIFFEEGCHEVEITGGDTPIVTTVEAVTIENPVEAFPYFSKASAEEATWLYNGNIKPFLNTSVENQPEDIARKITQLLWLAEKNPSQFSAALAFSFSLANQYPLNAELEPLINKFVKNSIWTAISTQKNAGIRTVDVEGWQVTAPNLRARKALLSALETDEEIVFGNEYLILALVNPEPTTLQFELHMTDFLNVAPQNLTVNYQLDKTGTKSIQLTPNTPKSVLKVAVPKGEHALRINMENPFVGQLLRVRMFEKDNKKIVQKLKIPYEVATQNDPIVAKIVGPAWVRIDEWRNGKIITNYRYIASNTETLKLFPKQDQKEALYRLSARIPFSEKANILARPLNYITDPVPAAVCTSGYYQPKEPLHYRLCNPLTIHNSTWSFRGLYNERIDIEEQGTFQSKIEQYFELNAAHRRYAENIKTYFNTKILSRKRKTGGNTFGLSEQIGYYPYLSSWSFHLDTYGFIQKPERNRTEWSTLFQGSITQKRDITPKAYHLPTLTTFKRLMSLSRTQNRLYSPGVLDQDIYTDYKSLHRFGLEVSDTVVYRPKMDTLFLSNIGAVSRQDYRIYTPDHLKVSFDIKQLIGDYQLNAGYRFQKFYKDKNKYVQFARKNNFKRRTVTLELSKKRWLGDHLFEFTLGTQRQVEFKKSMFSLSFTYHFTHNRYYSDFSPRDSESEFVDIAYPQTQQWKDCGE